MQLVDTFRSAPRALTVAFAICCTVAIVDTTAVLLPVDNSALKQIGGWTLGGMFAFAAIGVSIAAGGKAQGRLMVWCIFAIQAISLAWRATRPPTGNPYLDVSPLWPLAAFALPALVLVLLHLPSTSRHVRTAE